MFSKNKPVIKPVFVSKTLEEWEEEREKFKKEHLILNFLKYSIKYPFRRFFNKYLNFADHYRTIKWFIQRGIRGYSEQDTWNYCTFLSNILQKGLKDFKKLCNSYPSNLTEEKWKEILDTIIFTFETEYKLMDMDAVLESSYNTKEQKERLEKMKINHPSIPILDKEQEARYKQGWKYFQKYFRDLWD